MNSTSSLFVCKASVVGLVNDTLDMSAFIGPCDPWKESEFPDIDFRTESLQTQMPFSGDGDDGPAIC